MFEDRVKIDGMLDWFISIDGQRKQNFKIFLQSRVKLVRCVDSNRLYHCQQTYTVRRFVHKLIDSVHNQSSGRCHIDMDYIGSCGIHWHPE